ncbi:hypothetical protein HNR64_003282 [Spongiibacter marinus]|nr:hypothetical protein [Spongiibacter marinus]
MNPKFDLVSGPGYHLREQAALAYYACQPGTIDHRVTCCRCGDVGRPTWAPLGELGPASVPPLPRAWTTTGNDARNAVCASCISTQLDQAIKAMSSHARSPQGQKELAQ